VAFEKFIEQKLKDDLDVTIVEPSRNYCYAATKKNTRKQVLLTGTANFVVNLYS
jgi:hypothetical protein